MPDSRPAPAPSDPLAEEKKKFFRAIRLEEMETLGAILDRFPDAVHWREDDKPDGLTGLHAAAQHDCVQAAALLCSRGADPNARDKTRWTPAHYAAKNNSSAMFDVLVVAKADLEAETSAGELPLLIAVKQYRKIMQLFREKPDMRRPYSMDAIEKLVVAGADARRENAAGESAYSVAEQSGISELTLLLLGAEQKRRDYADIKAGKEPTIKVMKKLAIRKNAPDNA